MEENKPTGNNPINNNQNVNNQVNRSNFNAQNSQNRPNVNPNTQNGQVRNPNISGQNMQSRPNPNMQNPQNRPNPNMQNGQVRNPNMAGQSNQNPQNRPNNNPQNQKGQGLNNNVTNQQVNKAIKDSENAMFTSGGKGAGVGGMSTYQAQMLQTTTKAVKSKKLIAIIISAVVVLLGGAGTAVAIILSNRNEESASINCVFNMATYSIMKDVPITSESLTNSKSVFEYTFNDDTTDTIHSTNAINANITLASDFVIAYSIDNKTDQSYTYFIDFSELQIENCTITITNSTNDESATITTENTSYAMATKSDVVFYVRVSVADSESASLVSTGCAGAISITISV